jgi:hypothetical protein
MMGNVMELIHVALPKAVVDLIGNELMGKLGEDSSDIVRAIVISWLSEQGYLSKLKNPSEGETHEPRKHALEDALKKLES